jgi:uncharacterized protein YjbI with pentapeptide repeats
MPNSFYTAAREQFLQGGINLASADVKIVLVDTGAYTFSAAHAFLSDIPSGARVATSANLASKTFTGGTFRSADAVLSAVSGVTIEAFVIYVDTGTASTSRLVFFSDSNVTNVGTGGAAFPFTPNGSGVTVGNANGWFTLGATIAG